MDDGLFNTTGLVVAFPPRPSTRELYCNGCQNSYPPVFFRLNPHPGASAHAPERRATCIGCEQTRRDSRKETDRFIAKARSTISRHASKYRLSVPAFTAKYGWDLPRVAHLLRHAYENTCIYCRRPYAGMKHGPADVTMDVYDRDAEPYLDTNTRQCCQTCNREKSTLRPEVWAQKLICWRRYETRRDRSPLRPQLEMFPSS